MGFMDMLGEFAGKTMASAEETAKYQKEYKSLSDDRLLDMLEKYSKYASIDKMNTEGGQRFRAISIILKKDRGYDPELLKAFRN